MWQKLLLSLNIAWFNSTQNKQHSLNLKLRLDVCFSRIPSVQFYLQFHFPKGPFFLTHNCKHWSRLKVKEDVEHCGCTKKFWSWSFWRLLSFFFWIPLSLKSCLYYCSTSPTWKQGNSSVTSRAKKEHTGHRQCCQLKSRKARPDVFFFFFFFFQANLFLFLFDFRCVLFFFCFVFLFIYLFICFYLFIFFEENVLVAINVYVTTNRSCFRKGDFYPAPHLRFCCGWKCVPDLAACWHSASCTDSTADSRLRCRTWASRGTPCCSSSPARWTRQSPSKTTQA